MIRLKLLLIILIIQLFPFLSFGKNGYNEFKYFSKDIVSKIVDSKNNMNLFWSDFLVIFQNYNIWSDINLSNYDGVNKPFITSWIDLNDLIVIDPDKFYFLIKSDTVSLSEEVFTDNIEGKTIKIVPLKNNKNIRFKVSVAVDEEMRQFLSVEDYNRDGVEDKEALLETWQKVSPYQPVKDLAQYHFKVPERDSMTNIKHIKADLALGDTALYYEAEGGGHDLNYIYKGKPAEHRIRGMLIRIERYNRDQLIETKYIRIFFPESC